MKTDQELKKNFKVFIDKFDILTLVWKEDPKNRPEKILKIDLRIYVNQSYLIRPLEHCLLNIKSENLLF